MPASGILLRLSAGNRAGVLACALCSRHTDADAEEHGNHRRSVMTFIFFLSPKGAIVATEDESE
jgi:hypothetical protein